VFKGLFNKEAAKINPWCILP